MSNTKKDILLYIHSEKEVSRIELSKKFKLRPSGVTKIINNLIEKNLVIEKGFFNSTGGRRGVKLSINPECGYVIGINFGPGIVEIIVSNIGGKIIENIVSKVNFKSAKKVIELLENQLDDILNRNKNKYIIGIGLAINGIVNCKSSVSVYSPHLKWNNFNIKEYFEKKYNLPVIIDNDVRAMLNAHLCLYKEKEYTNTLFLYLKDGVGSSLYINDKIYTGEHYCAGEIGHYVVDLKSNIKCKCGKFGCFESLYNTSAIRDRVIWELEKSNISTNNLNISKIIQKTIRKEEPYYSIISLICKEIGLVLGNILSILDVKTIIVASEMNDLGDIFFNNLKRGINQVHLLKEDNNIVIKETPFKKDVEKYGAISLVISNLFKGEKLFKI